MKRYKFLKLKNKKIISSYNEKFKWEIGKWYKTDGELSMCENGFHCSIQPSDAFYYVSGEVLAIVETKGKSIEQLDKQCWEQMRIVKAYGWTKKDSIALAIYSAELVLPNFEKEYPDDDRPRKAIEAAKKVLENDTKKNRSAARSAAWGAESAAWGAESVARSAAASAAWGAESVSTRINKWMIKHINELEEI